MGSGQRLEDKMPYSLTMPSPIEVGQHFIVDLHVSGLDAVVGKQYQLALVPAPASGTITIDTHTVEIKALETDDPQLSCSGA